MFSQSFLQVRFAVEKTAPGTEPHIKGSVTYDPGGRTKVVFLAMGLRQFWKSWSGLIPQDGEEWVCALVMDKAPNTPWSGALLVRLVRKAEKEDRWDFGFSDSARELFGARPGQVTHVTHVGLRQEGTENTWSVLRSEDIRPYWPEEIRAKAAEAAAGYEAARRKFEAMIRWPKLPEGDPSSREIETEVGGYPCRFCSTVSVGPDGLARRWTLMGPVSVTGPVQVLTDKVRTEPGKPFAITRRAELEELCSLFGAPEIREASVRGSGSGKASWSDFQLELHPAVLFCGPCEVSAKGAGLHGEVGVEVLLPDLGIVAEVDGFSIEPEKQKAIALIGGRWRAYSRVHVGFSDYDYLRVKLEPVVFPAHVSPSAVRYLSAEQCAGLIAGAGKWSLADHTVFFRSALLASSAVTEAGEVAGLLRRLVETNDFSIQVLSYQVIRSEGESRDGKFGLSEWVETVHAPTLTGSFGKVKVNRDLANDIDSAIRWYITDTAGRLKGLFDGLRESFAAEARYEEPPSYSEPPSGVSEEEKQEVSRKAVELLGSLEEALAASGVFLEREAVESFSARAAKKTAEEEREAKVLSGRIESLRSHIDLCREGQRSDYELQWNLELWRPWSSGSISELRWYKERAEALIARAEDELARLLPRYEARQRLGALLRAEYAICPVCSEALQRPHYCALEWHETLRGVYTSLDDGLLKASRAGGIMLVDLVVFCNSLVVFYNGRYCEYGLEVRVGGDEALDALVTNPDPGAIETKVFLRQPGSKEEEVVRGNTPGTTSFAESGRRYFRSACCGGMARLTTSQMARFAEGETFTLSCPVCGATGTVRRPQKT